MLRWTAIVVGCALGAASAGCGRGEGRAHGTSADRAAATAPAGRRVSVEVGRTGYAPNRIEAKPGERLVLRFTRTADTECGRYVTVAGTDIKRELPLGEPVDVAVTAPQSGELVFACGMDMMHGIVVVKP